MTKQLFEEALADVKQVKQMAEDNAKRAVIDAVTPRIRDFIEAALLREEAMPGMPGSHSEDDSEELLTDLVVPAPEAPAAAISPPDAEGKVTLDIDALCGGEATDTGPGAPVPPPMFGEPAPKPAEDEYEISLESIDALKPVLSAAKKNAARATDTAASVSKLAEHVRLLEKASAVVRGTQAYRAQIAQMISHVEDMYDHVQESVADPAKKSSYELTLEDSFKALNTLQESTMSKQSQRKSSVNEADLTLKLTGLPDEVEDNLDNVGVDLITGEEGEEGAEGHEDVEGGDEAGLDDLDMGDEQGTDQDEDTQMETRKLSDDTIVEIDEKMLRREIARMRTLREETKPAAWGDGVGAKEMANFGGGSDAGDAVDQEIDTAGKVGEPLGESDGEDLEEQDQMDEQDDQMEEQDDLDEQDDQMDELDQMGYGMDQAVHPAKDMAMQEQDQDDLDQLGNRRKEDEYGTAVSDGHETATWDKRRHEGLKRLGFEKKLQERAKARAAALKAEAARAKRAKNSKRLAEVRKEYAVVAKRFNESLARSNKASKLVAAATKKLHEARSNSVAARPAGNKAEEILRKKLAETNLFNAKLLFTNKLLQNEQLTSRQKAQVIKQLDEAKTVREAKLVYESLARTLAGPSKPLSEAADRKVLGSASRATRPASTQTLNEGYETERWAQLAGIVK